MATNTPPPCEDTNANGNTDDDADGLCDGWEVNGIDADDDGTIDFRLPGAKRDHKDAYLEIDHMASHRPFAGAVSDVVAAFARAPVTNPDRTIGITLHAELGESVPESAKVAFVPCTAPASGGAADFDDIKREFFGTATQRAAGPDTIDAKRFAYRYVLFAHNLLGLGGTSGCAELPGNDFLVTLGSWALIGGHQVGTRDQQSGTLMHELGHTFGLHHGGSTDANCKPNYLSIMSYTRQMTGSPIVGRPLDYSRAALPALNENALSEPTGVGGPAGSFTAFGPPPVGLEPASGPIDWDGDGNTTDTGLALDLNLLPNQGCDGDGTVLTGFNDWSNLVYDFQNASASADGVRPASAVPVEITFEQAAANSGDADGDGVRDFEDICQTAANASQLDSDADGIGDACDADTPPGGPAPGGGVPGAVPPLPACDEDVRPAASLLKDTKGVKLARRRLTVRGRAVGTACRPVARVEVAISRTVRIKGRKRCRFVTSAAGKLGRPRACTRPVRIRAKGKTTWRLVLKRKLPPGRYTLQVRAADPTGARQVKPAKRSFRVR